MNPTQSNPFFNRHRITDPDYFCGRRSQVEQIYSAIVTRQSRSIVGERKLGKSSLLTYITHPRVMQKFDLDPAHFIFIYLDLEGMMSATRPEFWLEIVEQCYSHLSDERLRHRFDRYLDSDDEIRFTTVRRLLRRVRDAGMQIVCALDEFECLAENGICTRIPEPEPETPSSSSGKETTVSSCAVADIGDDPTKPTPWKAVPVLGGLLLLGLRRRRGSR